MDAANASIFFNLDHIDTTKLANNGVTINLRHPADNTPLPLSVTILGADSDKFRRVFDAKVNVHIKNTANPAKAKPRTAEENRTEHVEAVAECVVGWTGFAMNDEPLACTTENKLQVFGKPGFSWMLEQLDAEIRDRANFLQK